MKPPALIERDRCLLVVVDVQEKLLPAVLDPAGLILQLSILLEASQKMEVPVLFTEHCSGSIGPTVAKLRDQAPDARLLEKTHFQATAEPEAIISLKQFNRPQVVLAGTEAHVCVLQTAIGLLGAGFEVFLVRNAISSRTPEDLNAAISRLKDMGATIVTTEMVLFEWLERADIDEFKTILQLVR